MEFNRKRHLRIEIYKTRNIIKFEFYVILSLRQSNRAVRSQYRLNLEIPKMKQVTFCNKIFGPKIWNSLPLHIKSSENINTFKKVIKSWNGITFNCQVCLEKVFRKQLLLVFFFHALLLFWKLSIRGKFRTFVSI